MTDRFGKANPRLTDLRWLAKRCVLPGTWEVAGLRVVKLGRSWFVHWDDRPMTKHPTLREAQQAIAEMAVTGSGPL